MIAAEIKLNLCDGYEIDAHVEKTPTGRKVKMTISIAECDVEIWLPEVNSFGDEVLQAMPAPKSLRQERTKA